MENIVRTITSLARQVEGLLTGEPARFIFYGAAILIWAITAGANALGITAVGPTIALEDALVQATIAGALITELIRRYVYSPNTVATERVDAYLSGYSTALRDESPAPGDTPVVTDLDS